MDEKFEFDGEYAALKEFQSFLTSHGLRAETHVGTLEDERLFRPDFDPITGLPRNYQQDTRSVWMTVIGSITDLAKQIVEFLTQKKSGQIAVTFGGKTKEITRTDSVGNVEKILKEAKGTRISIKIEV